MNKNVIFLLLHIISTFFASDAMQEKPLAEDTLWTLFETYVMAKHTMQYEQQIYVLAVLATKNNSLYNLLTIDPRQACYLGIGCDERKIKDVKDLYKTAYCAVTAPRIFVKMSNQERSLVFEQMLIRKNITRTLCQNFKKVSALLLGYDFKNRDTTDNIFVANVCMELVEYAEHIIDLDPFYVQCDEQTYELLATNKQKLTVLHEEIERKLKD